MAQLASTVYVEDPDSRQTVTLDAGTSPEPRLAALVPNPAAWVDGKLPRLPKAKADPAPDPQNTGDDDPDGASGDASDTSDAGNQAAPAAKKPAARKSAATKPARGRDAAEQGTSGE